MCGITGFIDYTVKRNSEGLTCTVQQMTKTLFHRGPDDGGVWVDAETGAAMGQRRLSIVDLSGEGHQPMVSAGGRYVIVFNGEVYNFRSLKARLEAEGKAPDWRGHSDTEVMLAAIEAWGLRQSVEKFIGMFAFALWDKKTHTLHLVRDRLGIKPLYFGFCNKVFLFASELKALIKHPAFTKKINRDVLSLYLRFGYVPAPYSIYEGIYKLLPGTILSLQHKTQPCHSFVDFLRSSAGQYTPYWSMDHLAIPDHTNDFNVSDTDQLRHFEKLLLDAVGQHMVSDVPLGAFLSGGIDSTLVVALMQAQSQQPVKTFTIGFYEDNYSEANYAKETARYLGTDHHEFYVSPEEAMAIIPKIPFLYDEPFADPSQIPTFIVSKMARQQVKVVLSGDGGDELFGGYQQYFWADGLWNKSAWMPTALKKTLFHGSRFLSPKQWDRVLSKPFWPISEQHQKFLSGDKLYRLAEMLQNQSKASLYLELISYWKNPASVLIGAEEPHTAHHEERHWSRNSSFILNMMHMDLITYLPDDILVKVDRASMGVGLEARVPLLDHRVVEFACQVPLKQKIRTGQSKWLLRQVLDQYVPRELMERPKMGFALPIEQWLRGPLREWAEHLLDRNTLVQQQFFVPEIIHRVWDEHLSGERNRHYMLWSVLMFQSWLEYWEHH